MLSLDSLAPKPAAPAPLLQPQPAAQERNWVVPVLWGSTLAAGFSAAIFWAMHMGWLAGLMAGLAMAAATSAIIISHYRSRMRALTNYILAVMNPTIPTKDRPALPDQHSTQKVSLALSQLEDHWQKQLEQLSQQLDIEQTVLDILPDPLVLLNKDRKVVQANRAAIDMFGTKILSGDIAQLLRDMNVIAAIDAGINGEPPIVVEYTWQGPIERVFQARVAPFRRVWINPFSIENRMVQHSYKDKDSPAVMLIMNDVTVLKRAEESRIDFIANVSHELRTPLSSIIGFIETIRGPARDDGEARDRFLGIMHEQASRMARLVSDLLSLSRIELDEHNPPADAVDLKRVLGSLLATLELRAAERGMTIAVDAPRNIPKVIGDRDQLIQAFQNLIENAIKYGPENSTITLSAALHEEGLLPGQHIPRRMVAVSVASEGEGIPKEHLSRLTERFYRVDSGGKNRRVPGTGLGLAIVKHIVSRHRGRLTIASEPGSGAVFSIYLPIDPSLENEED